MRSQIPRPTMKRLSVYLREIESSGFNDEASISSRQLGEATGVAAAQVRRDLACVGHLGHRGVGYCVGQLREELSAVFARGHDWSAALVGIGNIGRALLAYDRFAAQGFRIAAVFDKSPPKKKTLGYVVHPMSGLTTCTNEMSLRLGIIAVPAVAAQEVADQLVAAGITGILNFAPRHLDVPSNIPIRSVDLTRTLEQLAFEVAGGSPDETKSKK